MKTYEIHFCEGSYFMAKEKGTEQGIIDNTITEFIGNFETTNKGIINLLQMLKRAYNLQLFFPIEID